jgi:hypothetical protein
MSNEENGLSEFKERKVYSVWWNGFMIYRFCAFILIGNSFSFGVSKWLYHYGWQWQKFLALYSIL